MLERRPPDQAAPTPARAARSPAALGTGAVLAAIGLVAGIGPAAAAILGAIGWAGGLAAVLGRRRRPSRIEPTMVGEPWRHFVSAALSARSRFGRVTDGLAPGPLRDRLTEVGRRMDRAVAEVWAVARQGHGLDRTRQHVDRREGGPADLGSDEQRAQDARDQAAASIEAGTTRFQERLRALCAQLDEAVSRAAALSATAPGLTADTGDLDAGITRVIDELEALRLALDEGPGAGTGPPS